MTMLHVQVWANVNPDGSIESIQVEAPASAAVAHWLLSLAAAKVIEKNLPAGMASQSHLYRPAKSPEN